jgi:predicted nucleic acid-binding protein
MIVYLDTNIVIYAVEKHPGFGPRAIARLVAAQAAGDTFMLSDLVRMECLVMPFRTGDAVVEAAFQAFFARPDVRVVPVTPAVADRAARLRAALRFKALDALHLAAAVEHGAGVFLTNDNRLNAFTGLTVEVLP